MQSSIVSQRDNNFLELQFHMQFIHYAQKYGLVISKLITNDEYGELYTDEDIDDTDEKFISIDYIDFRFNGRIFDGSDFILNSIVAANFNHWFYVTMDDYVSFTFMDSLLHYYICNYRKFPENATLSEILKYNPLYKFLEHKNVKCRAFDINIINNRMKDFENFDSNIYITDFTFGFGF